MFVLMNENNNEIYSFVVCETSCMTVIHVSKSGVRKCISLNVGRGMDLWSELKNNGWVELKKPKVDYPDYADNVELIR